MEFISSKARRTFKFAWLRFLARFGLITITRSEELCERAKANVRHGYRGQLLKERKEHREFASSMEWKIRKMESSHATERILQAERQANAIKEERKAVVKFIENMTRITSENRGSNMGKVAFFLEVNSTLLMDAVEDHRVVYSLGEIFCRHIAADIRRLRGSKKDLQWHYPEKY